MQVWAEKMIPLYLKPFTFANKTNLPLCVEAVDFMSAVSVSVWGSYVLKATWNWWWNLIFAYWKSILWGVSSLQRINCFAVKLVYTNNHLFGDILILHVVNDPNTTSYPIVIVYYWKFNQIYVFLTMSFLFKITFLLLALSSSPIYISFKRLHFSKSDS